MSHHYQKSNPISLKDLLAPIEITREHQTSRPTMLSQAPVNIINPKDTLLTEPNHSMHENSSFLDHAIRRFRGFANGEHSHDFDEEIIGNSELCIHDLSKESIDIFENFDNHYQAHFSNQKSEKIAPQSNKILPVCRDLIEELAVESMRLNPLDSLERAQKLINGKRLSKPKEFPTIKTGGYFGSKKANKNEPEEKISEMPLRNGVRAISKPVNMKSEMNQYEEVKYTCETEENEESRLKSQRNFIFVQNSAFSMIDNNYQIVQDTLKKIRSGNIISKNSNKLNQLILNDITNNFEKPIKRVCVKENGELRPVSIESFERRRKLSNEFENNKKKSIVYRSFNLKEKSVLPQIAPSGRSKENLCPTGINPSKANESKDLQKEKGQIKKNILGERRNSLGGALKTSQDGKLKIIGNIIEVKGSKVEKNQIKVVESKDFKPGTKNLQMNWKRKNSFGEPYNETSNRRSTSGNRW